MSTHDHSADTVTDRASARDVGFESYLAARQPSLLRTAHLLTGDRQTAEDLVETALARLYLSWDKVNDREPVDGYVHRVLVGENGSLWRRARRLGRRAEPTGPDRAASPATDGGSPIGPESVRRTARRIQRRRRLAAGAVTAAVAAVVVPVGFAMTDNTQSPRASTPPPWVTDPSPSTEPAGEVDLTTKGIPRGADPGVAYLQGRTLVQPEGALLDLPMGPRSVTPYRGGFLLAVVGGAGGTEVVRLDDNLEEVARDIGSAGFAVSLDGTQSAYSTTNGTEGTIRVADPSGRGDREWLQSVSAATAATPIGFVADGALVYQTGGLRSRVYLAERGRDPRRLDGLLAAAGTSEAEGLVAGQTRATGAGSCWTVMQVELGRRLWDTCDYSLGRFSPDSNLLVGTSPYGEGPGIGDVAMLDAQAQDALTTFVAPRDGSMTVAEVVWEDSTHLLAAVNQDGRWQVLRLGLDGSVAAATDPVPGDPNEPPPIRFAASP